MKRLLLFLIAFFCASCSEGSASGRFALPGLDWKGELVSHSDYPATVAIKIQGNRFCSGVLIAPDLVVTAAHCVVPIKEFDAVVIWGSSDARRKGDEYAISETVFHPYFWQLPPALCADELCPMSIVDRWNDIALVRTSRPIKDAPCVTIKELPAELHHINIIGYGQNRIGAPTGRLHRAYMRIDDHNEYEMRLLQGATGGVACYGDSGGPALAQVDGQISVIGIGSRILRAQGCGSGAVYTLLSPYESWIEETYRGMSGVSLSTSQCKRNPVLLQGVDPPKKKGCQLGSDSPGSGWYLSLLLLLLLRKTLS